MKASEAKCLDEIGGKQSGYSCQNLVLEYPRLLIDKVRKNCIIQLRIRCSRSPFVLNVCPDFSRMKA